MTSTWRWVSSYNSSVIHVPPPHQPAAPRQLRSVLDFIFNSLEICLEFDLTPNLNNTIFSLTRQTRGFGVVRISR